VSLELDSESARLLHTHPRALATYAPNGVDQKWRLLTLSRPGYGM